MNTHWIKWIVIGCTFITIMEGGMMKTCSYCCMGAFCTLNCP